MRSQPPTFTKEKAVFLFIALFCAFHAYSFIATRPLELRPGEQRVAAKTEPARLTGLPIENRDESAYFTGTRKSPFVVIWPKPPGGGSGTGPAGGGPSNGGGPTGGKKKKKDGPVSPDTLYDFAGVVVHDGTAHALLQVRGKPVTIRAGEGGTIDGGYQITRVDKQSIELRHKSGQTFLLRDRAQ